MIQHLPRTTFLSGQQQWLSQHSTASHFINAHQINQHHGSNTALQLGMGGIMERTASAYSGLLTSSSLQQIAFPAVSISATVLLLLWLEVRFHRRQQGGSQTQKVLNDLIEHRQEKSETLRHLFIPIGIHACKARLQSDTTPNTFIANLAASV